MHLTNYSVNKYNVDYEISKSNTNAENTGSKRSLKYLFDYLRTQKEDANKLWKDIQVKPFTSRKTIHHMFVECCDKNSFSRSTTFIQCISNVSSRCFSIE